MNCEEEKNMGTLHSTFVPAVCSDLGTVPFGIHELKELNPCTLFLQKQVTGWCRSS